MALQSEETRREREVLTELLETYRSLRYLWDPSDESYKYATQKKEGWDILVKILKQIEPTANIATVKKKIENMRASYCRVFKKVREAKRAPGSTADKIQKPFLWYFDLLSFLNKKNKTKRADDSLLCEGENDQQTDRKTVTVEIDGKRFDKEGEKPDMELKTENQITEHNSETNTFGTYVGEKLKQISSGQRDIAEKLISDVLFFASTNKLDVNSCIETPFTHYNTDKCPPRYSPLPYLSHLGYETSCSSSNFSPTPSPSLSFPEKIKSPIPSHHHHNPHELVPTSTQIIQPTSQYSDTPGAVSIKKEVSD